MIAQPFSIKQLNKALRQGDLSSVALTQHCLRAIHQQQDLNAFIDLDEEQVLIEAEQADKILKKGEAKPLTGIPMGVKDTFCTQRMRTTCASKMLANFHAPYEATVVKNLKAAGALLLGKTNMDEFAMGSSNEHSYFGPVKNPWDKERVPGGSSGGSAAAVAAGLVPFALGSDTGGSIRQPAAFCGISGIKPTYGLISRYGMVAYASSLDQAGPFANSAEDLSILLQAMAGYDPMDSSSLKQSLPDYSFEINQPIKGLRIGLPSCYFHEEVNKDIQQLILDAVEVFRSLGAELIPMDLSRHSLWVPCYYVVACAEASSNLSRFDGMRFGHRSSQSSDLMELISLSRSEGFGTEVQRRILLGTCVLSTGHYDAYYLQAQKIRRLIQEEFLDQLNQVDVILGPTTPNQAPKLGAPPKDPKQSYLSDVFTVSANLAGLPALSIPAGFANQLPVGLQLIGKHFSEARILQIAHHYQQKTQWHLRQALSSR